MTTREIGMEYLPLLEALTEVLDAEPNPVNQQIAIELLLARHAMRVGRPYIDIIIDGVTKHAKQLASQTELVDGEPTLATMGIMRAIMKDRG